MKKLINKIVVWFKPKPNDIHKVLFEACDKIAKEYGTYCRSLCINIHRSHYDNSPYIVVWVHVSESCASFEIEYGEIDTKKCLTVFESLLITNGYEKVVS